MDIQKAAYTVLATDSLGNYYGWGNNEYGQLGDDTIEMALSPMVILQNDLTTTIGTGDVNSIVPIVGSIDALTISVTHPANIAYTIDPNSENCFYASDIDICNNSKVPVRITIESFNSNSEGDLQFIDVLPDSKDWDNLNLEESKNYIALGLQYKNEDNWMSPEPLFTNPIYAAELNNTSVGVLAKGASGALKLSARHGLAFDRPYTAKHDLIFVFSLI